MKEKYLIGEVSDILGVKPHVLRYWEEEIPFIAPRKNISGRRVYTDRDMQILLRLKHLVYEKKYTLEGARQRIWSEINSEKADAKSKIASVRKDLLKIRSRVLKRQEVELTESEIIEKFTLLGQEHLFIGWQDRDKACRRKLLTDLEGLDLDLLKRLIQNLKTGTAVKPVLKPVHHLSHADFPATQELKEIKEKGKQLIEQGKAGFLTAAGGQGSRLGFDGPKGMFPISPIRKITLYQIFAEKILSARNSIQRPLFWYIMTSTFNHEQTVSYFRKNSFFGLSEQEVIFFPQGSNPSLTRQGKLILSPEGGLFKNPDGHGGVIASLRSNNLLVRMAESGIEELFYFQVDNPLVNVPDPVFLGIHCLNHSEISSKVIRKAYPEENLGTIGKINGRPGILEYSDLDKELMFERDEQGELLYSHGSIAIHLLNVPFLSRSSLELPLHMAYKSVKAFIPEPGGGSVKEMEAVKFEKFIFDAIPLASNPVFWETLREEEFAPLKNKTGIDSIETCIAGSIAKYASWLEKCGIAVARDKSGRSIYKLEISPLFASDVEILKNRLKDTVNSINEDKLFF